MNKKGRAISDPAFAPLTLQPLLVISWMANQQTKQCEMLHRNETPFSKQTYDLLDRVINGTYFIAISSVSVKASL